VRAGDEISIHYDPMIAKLITHGKDRAGAIAEQARALDEFVIEGPQNNIAFLGAVMGEKHFAEGDFTTAFIKQHFADGFHGATPSAEQAQVLIACAAYAQAVSARRAGGGRRDWVVIIAGAHQGADVLLDSAGASVEIGGVRARLDTDWRPGQSLMRGGFDGAEFALKIMPVREGYQLALRGVSLTALVASPRGAELHKRIPEKPKADTSKFIVSPMPGLVVSLNAAQGQKVVAGESVAVVEAMKMQNIIRAERDGVVAKVNVAPGASVAADEVLLELA
jgi:propionyl-CoA carboxylase alpha chain